MARRIRIDDVASAAGVSNATVSRALAKPERVRSTTLDRVLAAVSALKYQPDPAASALVTGRSNTVGCVVPTLDNAAFAIMAQALQTSLTEGGYQLLLTGHEYDYAGEADLGKGLLNRGVDALILVGNDRSEAARHTLAECGKPVLITWSSDERFPSISIDNEHAASMVAAHFLELGHRHIGMIAGFTSQNDRQRSRIAGVRSVLATAGCALSRSRLTEQPLSFTGGAAGLRTLLAASDPPTAIVCGNDYLAAGAMLQAQRMGIDVPSQLSICGFDDMDLAAALNPGLTTVHVPAAELGRLAAHSIMTLLEGEAVAQHVLLPVELRVRKSTAAPFGLNQLTTR